MRTVRMTTIVLALALATGLGAAVPAGAAAPHDPGAMTAGPTVVAGTTGNTLHFDYVAPATNTVKGQIQLVVPLGWSKPQKRNPGKKSALSVSASTCTNATIGAIKGSGPWTVAIRVTCPPSTGFTVDDANVTAPTTASAVDFPAANLVRATMTPLTVQPAITIAPGPADHLVVTGSANPIDPPYREVATADYAPTLPTTASYTAFAFDRFGNALGDVTASSVFGGAHCSANVCGNDQPGNYVVGATDGTAQGSTLVVVLPYSAMDMTCEGQNYDVDGNSDNACEVATENFGTTQAAAPVIATLPCYDSNTFDASTTIPSDRRVHSIPAVAGFDTGSGSAPMWSQIAATGGIFCINDYSVQLQVTGSAQPACYALTVITDEGIQSVNAGADGSATLTQGADAYGANSTVLIGVAKTCSSATLTENVSVEVSGHL